MFTWPTDMGKRPDNRTDLVEHHTTYICGLFSSILVPSPLLLPSVMISWSFGNYILGHENSKSQSKT